MSYKRSLTKDKNSINSDIVFGWVDEIFRLFVINKWTKSTPNLYSLATIASLTTNISQTNGNLDKHEHLVRKVLERIAQYSKQIDLTRTNKHLDEIKKAYRALRLSVLDLEVRLTYRALVGASSSFGRPAFEVGLAFDPSLNVPYIPSSSIKGAVRATCMLNGIFSSELVNNLFGDGSVGRLHFSDAYPVSRGVKDFILIPDVLTPHYHKGGEDVFKEDQAMPSPVPFLSIAPNSKFRFLIADKAQEVDDQIVEKMLKAVIVALSLGIGAKTSIGYGTFELLNASLEKGE